VTWTAVLVLAAGIYLTRLAGLLLGDRLRLSPWVADRIDLGATALLVALATTAWLTESGGFAGWSRAIGVAVGLAAAWRRLPFLLVVVLAAVTTAGLRALGLP
jgi:branched-subunit amino acid transport protein